MAISDNLQQKIQQAQQAGYNSEQINNYLKSNGVDTSKVNIQAPISKPNPIVSEVKSFGKNTIDAAVSGAKKVGQSVEEGAKALTENKPSTLGGEIKTGAKLAGAGIDAGLSGAGALFAPVSGLVKTLSDNASDNEHVQKFAQHISPFLDAANTGVSSIDELRDKHPDIAKNLDRTVSLLTLEGGGKAASAAGDVAKSATDAAKSGIETAAKSTADAVKTTASNASKGIAEKTAAAATSPGFLGKTLRRVKDYANDKREFKDLSAPVQEAIKTAIPAPYAKMIGDATPEEKQAAERMLDIQEQGVGDMSSRTRPESVIGARIMQAVKAVEGMNKKAGEAEGSHIGDLSGHNIDHSKTTDDFLDSLHSLNVHIDPEDSRLDFSKSEFRGPSNSKDRGLLQSVWNELQPGTEGLTIKNAKDLHTGRQALFNELKGRPTMDPFAPKAVSIAEQARKGLLADIGKQAGDAGTGYKTHTTNFAITHKALEDFYNILGKKWTGRPEDVRGLKTGEIFNRIKGNAGADAQFVLDNIEGLAAKGGFKSSIDPQKLIDINQLLKEIVGDTQGASLSGGVKRGVADAIENSGTLAKTLSGGIPGIVKGAVDFAEGNTRAEQIRALRKLLATEPF